MGQGKLHEVEQQPDRSQHRSDPTDSRAIRVRACDRRSRYCRARIRTLDVDGTFSGADVSLGDLRRRRDPDLGRGTIRGCKPAAAGAASGSRTQDGRLRSRAEAPRSEPPRFRNGWSASRWDLKPPVDCPDRVCVWLATRSKPTSARSLMRSRDNEPCEPSEHRARHGKIVERLCLHVSRTWRGRSPSAAASERGERGNTAIRIRADFHSASPAAHQSIVQS